MMRRSLTIPHGFSQQGVLRILQASFAPSLRAKFSSESFPVEWKGNIGKFKVPISRGRIRSIDITTVILPSQVELSLEFLPVVAALDEEGVEAATEEIRDLLVLLLAPFEVP